MQRQTDQAPEYTLQEADRCLICGAYTPEGVHVCQACNYAYGVTGPTGNHTAAPAGIGLRTARGPRTLGDRWRALWQRLGTNKKRGI